MPGGFIETQVVSGLAGPTAMELAPDGRIFVLEKNGRVRVIKNGALLATPFVTLTVDSNGERGLLGIAFDPNFASNQYVYLYYTATSPTTHNRLSRFVANGDVASAGSETVLLELNDLSSATNHNGGAIHFGLDGKLYVAVGDNANGANSQTLSNLLGKVLRLNSDGTIPTDNPFYTSTTGVNRAIWTLGLRNPFTFAVQPGTGRIYINDVGGGGWEEINNGSAGANYGWPSTEGPTTNPNYQTPVYSYDHSGGACAITGGTFYNPTTAQFPSTFVGKYFFAEHCSGWIKYLDPAVGAASVTSFITGVNNPVDLKVSSDGSLYYLARGGGSVYRVQYSANLAPNISTQPASQTVGVGEAVTFSVVASGEAPLSYQWQRNGANIAGATASSYTLASAALSDDGAVFRVIVSNARGTTTSNNATLTVTTNQLPSATITLPAAGTLYNAGDTITYAGTGSDPEDGTLPASAFTWQVDLHHDTHTHPFVAPRSGATSGSFTIPTQGETSANVWYRIYLTVRDSGGRTRQTFRDITPRKSNITLQSNPAGLQLTLDGQPANTPFTLASVVGMQRTLGASTQTVGGTTYVFQSWSDGGAATHNISTPAGNTTYTANFTAISCGTANMALGKPATASSSLGGNTATMAVDGVTGTRWESTHGVDPGWISVDLGSSQSVCRVVLNWENAAASAYTIQVSDSASGPWTTIATTTTGDAGIDDLTGLFGSGRYVRMHGTARTTAYGYSLWEFQVYVGDSTPPTATIPPTATTPPTMTRTGTAPVVTTVVPPTATRTPTTGSGCGTVNKALNRPATASSTENGGTVASNAVDGVAGTRWSSLFSDPQWIRVDLGATTSICRVRLNWEAAYGRAYQIQISNDAEVWTTIYTTTTGDGGIDDLTGLTATGRHLRMYGTTRATGYGYSLWELEVY